MKILSIDHEVVGTYSKTNINGLYKLNATNKEEVSKFLLEHNPDVVINTIALTSSVACEKNPKLAEELNYSTAKNITEISKEIGAAVVFISSSYVFDGLSGNYTEEDIPNPTTQYGKTKVMAEKKILELKNGIVLRVDTMYGYNGKEYNTGIIQNIFSNKDIVLGNPDQMRQPLLADDLADIIVSLVKEKKKGIFNVAGPDKISMLNFIKKLKLLTRNESKIHILEEKNLSVRALKNSTLDISKINSIGIKTHSLDKGLGIITKQLIEN